MRTETIKIYSINELSEEARKKAIEKERNTKEYLYFFKDECIEKIEEAGFEDVKNLQYSLSYSQGDGLSFGAKRYNKLVDLFKKHLGEGKDKTAQLLADNCTQIFSGNKGHYCYASKSDIDLYIENYTSSRNLVNTNNIDILVGKVLTDLENIYIDLCKELEKEGYSQYEYESSDEAIIEDLLSNGVEFTENGTIF